MKTDQTPVVFYKDVRFWLVVILSVALSTFILITNPV